ncbi:MAG TPA: C_GCAxxG_C_C family protein [Dehalococcoidia bacterium]|jgi:C_GCAxxG_C_C family probable redox protein|nr:C_GCAxxG_C_C family protein [Dehalococcoidia bacterium]
MARVGKEAVQKAYDLGKEYERTYRGCSQCVIAALQDAFEFRNDDVFKAATGLAGGGGITTDGSCGAYTGAILTLSSLLGRERDDFADPKGIRFRTHELVRRFRHNFIQEYGSVVCRNIQTKVLGRPYYLADPEEMRKFHDAGAHDVHCPEVVGKAARWMAELIVEENLLPQQ